METWYRVTRWIENIDSAAMIVVRSTEKTVWYKARTGAETSERIHSRYHKWYKSKDDAVKHISEILQSEKDAAYKKQLSSAAPALLEALELIVGDYEIPEKYDVKIHVSMETMEKAKAAIKLARGES